MKYSTRSSIVCVVLTGVMIGAGITTVPAAVFIYDAQRYGTLPTAQGWSETAGGGGSRAISNGNTFVVTDVNGNADFNYQQNPTLNRETPWQMRAQVGLRTDYSGTFPIYSQFVNDADADMQGGYSFGLAFSNSTTWVSLRGVNNLTPIGVLGTPILDVLVIKTNGTNLAGRGDDPITLQVFTNNVLIGTVATTLATGSNFNPSPSFVRFGNVFGAPTGTFVLNWATFGINEAAPYLIPEPSVVMLGVVGGVLAYRHRRRTRGR